MEKLIKEMLGDVNWAVVGASTNPEKAGNKIIKYLLDSDHNVFCINPNCDEINGLPTYKSVQDVIGKVEVLDFFTPPKATKAILAEFDFTACDKIWLQPGTYDDEILALATDKGFKVVAHGRCAIKEIKALKALKAL